MIVTLTAVQDAKDAATFFANTWPMYVHEISGFETDFYILDEVGRWQPDLIVDWTAAVTPAANLREPRPDTDPGQPFQKALIISRDGKPVGFVCVGAAPFKYMPEDVDFILAELFIVHPHRGTGIAETAVQSVFLRYPGRWCLRAIRDNARAVRFWRRILPCAQVQELTEGHEEREVVWRFRTADA